MKKLFCLFAFVIGFQAQAYELEPINCSGINPRNNLQYKLEAQPYGQAVLTELGNTTPYSRWYFTYYSRKSVTTVYSNRNSIGTYVQIVGVNGTYSVDFYMYNQLQFNMLCR